MNKLSFILLAVAVLCSCSKETLSGGDLQNIEIVASSFDFKSSYYGSGNLGWSYGDKINIFDGTASREFTTYVSESQSTASFFGQIASSWTRLVGIYPFNETNELLPDGKVRANFPSYQTAAAGGFTDGANISIGETSSASSLLLRNAGAYLKFSFTSSRNVRAIYIAPNTSGINISGMMTFNSSTAELIASSEGLNCVTLIPEGAAIAPGTYYSVVAPVKFEKGLRIFFRFSDGTIVQKKGENDLTPARNSTIDLGTIDVDSLPTVLEPSLDGETITLSFANKSTAFTESLPTTRTTGEKEYCTKVGGHKVVFLVNAMDEGGNYRGQGWTYTSGYISLMTNNCWTTGNVEYLDGITLPAIPGKRLIRVEIGAPGNTFPMNVTDRYCRNVFYDDDFATKPATKYNSNSNWLAGFHVFTMNSTKVGESYRLVARKSNSFCNISYITLTYETVVPGKVPAIY